MSKRATDFAPNKKDLNPIEIASRDEIAALQLRRMNSQQTKASKVLFLQKEYSRIIFITISSEPRIKLLS